MTEDKEIKEHVSSDLERELSESRVMCAVCCVWLMIGEWEQHAEGHRNEERRKRARR